ncbi:MAG: cytochrome c [Acidiferrobacterales bacterium]
MKWKLILVVPALLLSGCDAEDHMNSRLMHPELADASKSVKPQVKSSIVQQGLQLYRANCASCHGDQGQGAPNWQQSGTDGKLPPPPLNGTGHAWHHPMPVLVSTIKNGTRRIGGNMPPWQEKLTDTEIRAIIAWLQSRWPDELYQAWARMDREAAQPARK